MSHSRLTHAIEQESASASSSLLGHDRRNFDPPYTTTDDDVDCDESSSRRTSSSDDDSTTTRLLSDADLTALGDLLRSDATKIRTRVGLVPNYFLTRGEAIRGRKETYESFHNWSRKAVEVLLKIGRTSDFRDEASLTRFEGLLIELCSSVAGVDNDDDDEDESARDCIRRIINGPLDKRGNTMLHKLIKRRQLKFVKSLLLHCGECVDVNRSNAKGITPLDLAMDRLEVETVMLLLLYGYRSRSPVTAVAADEESSKRRRRNTLGYKEWIATDMVANLDTGRWLNKASVEAILDHARANRLPGELLSSWGRRGIPLDDGDIQTLGTYPKLFSITLADGCDAITNHECWATAIRHLILLRQIHRNNLFDQMVEPSPSPTVPSPSPTVHNNTPIIYACNDIYDFLKNAGADLSSQRVAGRTLFYSCQDGIGSRTIAIKLSKSSEEEKVPHPLVKEATMNAQMVELRRRYGLKSEYPTGSQLLRVRPLPDDIRSAVETQRSKGYHAFDVGKDANGVLVLAYCPPKGYDTYVNDPRIPLGEFQTGLSNAIHDYAVLARHGLFHAALVDIQHDATRESRPHLWSFESFLTRFRGGAGRIEGGFAGCGTPNVRVSGLGDLKHIVTATDVRHRYDPSVIHAQHNQLYDERERFLVSLIEQLGAGLFGASLLAGSSWQGRHERGVNDRDNVDLEKVLAEVYTTFLRGYLSISFDRATELLRLMGVNFELMTKQIKMFSTQSYVDVAETAPKRPLFGMTAKVLGKVSHPTAFPHFCQRASRALDKPGQSLEAIRSVYQSHSTDFCPEEHPRVDTSMMRSSPTWVRGQGWVDRHGTRRHLGSYEGVLPFQQLIRDLYVVVHIATMLRIEQGDLETHTPDAESYAREEDVPGLGVQRNDGVQSVTI